MQKSAEKCRKRSRLVLSVLIVCVAVILLGFNNPASAITGITSTLIPTLYSVEGTPILRIKQGESFNFTLTAQNPSGTVTWQTVTSGINLSATTGNSTTVSGTFTKTGSYTDGSYQVIAMDQSSNLENMIATYDFWIQDIGYENNGNSTPSPSPVTSPDTPAEIEIAIISPVPDLSPDVIARLAQNISIDPSELILLTSADFDPSDPPEPTQAMRQEVSSQNGQFLAKLNTIKVNKDGWYVFKVTVSDDIKGMSVNDLKLFEAEGSDFTSSFGIMSIFNGVTGMYEVTNLFGLKVDTVEKQILVTMLLSAGKSITTYFVKILLMLLMGGCSAGIGIGAVFVVAGIIATKFFKKRR